MKNIFNLGLTLVTVISLSSCSNSEKTGSEKDSLSADSAMEVTQDSVADSASMQGDDPKLVYELVESMYGGIAVMKQGEEKATTPSVKALATKLATEHTKLTEELKALATKKNWTLPVGESTDDKSKREDLAKKTGTDYDKAWLEALADRHKTNIGKLEDAKPTDPDLKAAGQMGLPKIKALLADIEAAQTQVK
jgi:putative membrane protein